MARTTRMDKKVAASHRNVILIALSVGAVAIALV